MPKTGKSLLGLRAVRIYFTCLHLAQNCHVLVFVAAPHIDVTLQDIHKQRDPIKMTQQLHSSWASTHLL